jgi:aryl-alcohol dehydrogenase-like predicted oxidoreductase
MKINTLGNTGLQVSELGFGAFAIGGHHTGNSYGPTDDRTSIAAIHTALDLGYTFFDTANVYGNGHSEEVLGRALRHSGCVNEVVLASKVGGRWSSADHDDTYAPAYIAQALEATLKRLGRDYLDLYQLHNPPPQVVQQGAVFEVLERLRQAGKIRHYGVSIHTPADGFACLNGARAQTLQLPYNLFSLLEPDDSPEVLFAPAAAQGVGLIAREPLAAGHLSGRHGLHTAYGPGDNRGRWSLQRRRMLLALVQALRRLEQPGVTLAQAALRFVLDEPAVSTTIVGIKTPGQARSNAQATRLASFAELERAGLQTGAQAR